MITLWKLTISTFRLGKFSKISFTMAVDRNAVISLCKSGKSNVEIAKRLDMNRSMVWKNVNKSRRPETPLTNQGAEENGVSAPLNFSKTLGKSCDETLAEAAEPWPLKPVWANTPCTSYWETILGWSSSRCWIARSLRSRVFPVSSRPFSRFAISTLTFPFLWRLITAFGSTAIVKLIFENFGIPSLIVESVSF